MDPTPRSLAECTALSDSQAANVLLAVLEMHSRGPGQYWSTNEINGMDATTTVVRFTGKHAEVMSVGAGRGKFWGGRLKVETNLTPSDLWIATHNGHEAEYKAHLRKTKPMMRLRTLMLVCIECLLLWDEDHPLRSLMLRIQAGGARPATQGFVRQTYDCLLEGLQTCKFGLRARLLVHYVRTTVLSAIKPVPILVLDYEPPNYAIAAASFSDRCFLT